MRATGWMAIAWAGTSLLGCALENPCPEGMERAGTRCRVVSDVAMESPWPDDRPEGDRDPEPIETAAPQQEPSMGKGASEPTLRDAGLDAAPDVGMLASDAELDSDVVIEPPDAAALSPQDGATVACSDDALKAWRNFQLSSELPKAIASCDARPECAPGTCSVDPCMKRAASVQGCDSCIEAELSCLAKSCLSVCRSSTADDACRACACAAGCFNAPLGCGSQLVDACADCSGAGCTAHLAAQSETVTIPIYFHFVYDRSDPATGLYAYAVSTTKNETMLDIDARLADANRILEAARPDARHLRLVRVGVNYQAASSLPACPDPVAVSDTPRVYSALNVVLMPEASGCPSVSVNAYAARASAHSLLPEIAHMLGLWDTDRGNDDWSTVEFLYRDRESASQASCYRRGDFVCDTPPDYGYVGENRCSSLIAGHDLCSQLDAYPFGTSGARAPCDMNDPVVDAAGACQTVGEGSGLRTYDPALLGLIPDSIGNIMGGHRQDVFSPEQLVRMHNYAQWRLSSASRVGTMERNKAGRMNYGPSDALWNRITERDYGLSNAQILGTTQSGAFTLPATLKYAPALFDPRARVLGVRFSAGIDGSPSPDLRVTVSRDPLGAVVVPREAIRVSDNVISVDEAFTRSAGDSPLSAFRGMRALGTWSVKVEDSALRAIQDPRLEVLQSDRTYLTNDRHGRGAQELMVYRPSTSELLTAFNSGSESLAFGTPVLDQLMAPPIENTKVLSGDVDGDGRVDLIARLAANIWIAYGMESYAVWRPGSIAGQELPAATDEVLMGDFDGDGYGDLMRRRPQETEPKSSWFSYRGVGDGRFEIARVPSIDAIPGSITWSVGDLDADGTSEIVTRTLGSGLVSATINTTARPTTSGSLPILAAIPATVAGLSAFGTDSDELLLLDVNQDGLSDLVRHQVGTTDWRAHLNRGAGKFDAALTMTIGSGAPWLHGFDVVLGALP